MKKKSVLFLSLIISCLAICWVLRKVDPDEFGKAAGQIEYFWLLPCVLVYLLGFLPRGVRWQLMLSTISKVTVADSTRVVILGYAANNLLPFRLGEIVRAYVMGNRNNISKITCLGSIAAERIIDGIVIILLLGISTISLTASIQTSGALKQILLSGGAVFLSAVFLLIVGLIYSDTILRIWEKLIGKRGFSALEKTLHSLSFLRAKRILLKVVSLSLIVWLMEGVMFVLLSWQMGLANPVATGYFCMGIINLGILIPSAPGYVGVFQAASVFAFLVLGYGESAGLAYGLLIHLAQYLPVTITGILIFMQFRYNFGNFYKTISGET